MHLLEEINRVKNRATQICETVNLKVSSVASDLFGTSGRRMLRAIISGKRDAGWMAGYAIGRLRSRRPELELALQGSFTPHQIWLLEHALAHLEQLEAEVEVAEQEIRVRMQPWADPIARLLTIPGIDTVTAWTLLAELGPDMSVFGDARQAASWAGLCPGNHESGGKRMSGRTRKANGYVRRVMCEAAWGATRKKHSYLPGFYRRIRSRRGHHKALVALAHHLLIIAYHVLRDGTEYVEKGENYRDRIDVERTLQRLSRRLRALGFYVTLQPMADPLADIPESVEQAPSEPQPAPGRRKRGRPCKCGERGIPCRHLHAPSPPDISVPSGLS